VSAVRTERHRLGDRRAALHVILDRPQRGNRIDADLARGLREAVGSLDDGVAVVLLRAEGSNFCVGGDLAAIEQAVDAGGVTTILDELHGALHALVSAPVPVVCAVQGWVAGAGLGLLAASDIVIAGASVQLRPAYLAVGLSPDGGTSWALTRALGVHRAMDVLLSDGVLTSAEALQAGLLSRVVDDAEVLAVAASVAEQLGLGPTAAYRRTRELVRAAESIGWAATLEREAEHIVASAAGPEGREGIRAFLEGRLPRF
jgi:2-(1,2-epoxy-1,2-dihydrophenyl)acetyl-CoA isomerase